MTDEGEHSGVIDVTGVAQREAWREKRLPPVEKVRTDLWSIPVVMGNSPMRYTSVYVLGGTSELTLVDTGCDRPESWDGLVAGLAELGATPADVTGCVVTHFHYDHLGLAGRLQREFGTWVGLHPADLAAIHRPHFRDGPKALVEAESWLRRMGASDAEVDQLKGAVAAPDHRPVLDRADRLLEDGDTLALDGWTLRALHTPGHTPGHLCFVEDSARLFFSGDHVLPRISPNITGDRREEDPLGDYLASLAKIEAVDVDEVLPAHEWRFAGLGTRVREIRRHHTERLAELLDVVAAHPRGVPWDLAGGLTWSRPWDQYDGYMRLSAVGETVSHLTHLARRGDVLVSDEPVPRYVAAAGAAAGW
jgi:glyoxylase-like metal-dependent hydrolase (beta-lactamase superfamily II)